MMWWLIFGFASGWLAAAGRGRLAEAWRWWTSAPAQDTAPAEAGEAGVAAGGIEAELAALVEREPARAAALAKWLAQQMKERAGQ